MTQTQKPARQGAPDRNTNAPTPERAPHESNDGYESDHPSYQLRNAGDWSPRFGEDRYASRSGARPASPRR